MLGLLRVVLKMGLKFVQGTAQEQVVKRSAASITYYRTGVPAKKRRRA